MTTYYSVHKQITKLAMPSLLADRTWMVWARLWRATSRKLSEPTISSFAEGASLSFISDEDELKIDVYSDKISFGGTSWDEIDFLKDRVPKELAKLVEKFYVS